MPKGGKPYKGIRKATKRSHKPKVRSKAKRR